MRAFNPTRAEHGYEPLGSVVETNTDDWPFLVDSVSGELEGRGLGVARLLHPVVGVERDGEGRIADVGRAREAPHRESVMHFDLARRLDDDELAELEDAVREVLLAVRGVVADFQAMTERVDDMITVARAGTARYPRDEVHEVADFLEWLLRGNFVLLGAREYDFSDGAIRVVDGSGLGHPARRGPLGLREPVPLAELPPACASAPRAATCCWSPRRTRSRRCTGTSGWTTSASAASRAPARSSASRACSACSPRRRTPSARPRRRCCTASCARRSTPRT